MFNSQQQEEDDFFPQTEFQNALSEAMPHALRERGPVPTIGTGRIAVTVSAPVFCKCTDAFAGNMVVAIRRFSSETSAHEWIQLQYDESGGHPEEDYVLVNERKIRFESLLSGSYQLITGKPLNPHWREILKEKKAEALEAFRNLKGEASLRTAFAGAITHAENNRYPAASGSEKDDCPF